MGSWLADCGRGVATPISSLSKLSGSHYTCGRVTGRSLIFSGLALELWVTFLFSREAPDLRSGLAQASTLSIGNIRREWAGLFPG